MLNAANTRTGNQSRLRNTMMIRVSGGRMTIPSPNGIGTGISLYHSFPRPFTKLYPSGKQEPPGVGGSLTSGSTWLRRHSRSVRSWRRPSPHPISPPGLRASLTDVPQARPQHGPFAHLPPGEHTGGAIERKNREPGKRCPDRIGWLPVVYVYRSVVTFPSPERNTGYCILSIKEFLRDASSDS